MALSSFGQLCALAAAVIVGAPTPGFPPAATGSCKGPTDCMACVDTRCKAEAGACAQSDSCSASAACLMSTIQDHHVADTPTDCQSLDCVAPCFAANSTAAAVAYLACAAKCLPQTAVPPGQPQQVHLALAGPSNSVAVSWLTIDTTTRSSVMYGKATGGQDVVEGKSTSYTFSAAAGPAVKGYQQGVYKSGLIHHTVLPTLEPDTEYWYQCGGPNLWSARFTFRSAPEVGRQSLPYVLGLTGDLGQTNDSNVNIRHFSEDSSLQSVLHVGDLSYADSQMMRWESWGRMIEPVAARTPWMVAAGNHEVEQDSRQTPERPAGDLSIFNTYQHRFRMPAPESSHGLPMEGNFWYSCKRSHSAFGFRNDSQRGCCAQTTSQARTLSC